MIGTRLKDAPTDPQELAQVLGISAKRLVRLKEKHGDGLLIHLRREWRDRQDRPRLLHRDSSHGYTDSPELSMVGEPEAVSESFQERLAAEGRSRFAELRARKQKEVDPRAAAARMRQLQTLAQKRGIDAAPHLLKVESALRGLEAELEAAA